MPAARHELSQAAPHGRQPGPALVRRVEEAERGSNHETRRCAWAAARKRCARGRGFLQCRSDPSKYYLAPCRSWRDCTLCARAYGALLAAPWSKVTGLYAFVVLTMPAELGDWRRKENLLAMMRAWCRPYERLCRRFKRRPKAMHFKEHAGASGRLHLNVLWDWQWIDQAELSELAAESGFGPICHISRIGRRGHAELSTGRPGSSAAAHYSAKTGFRIVAYARKTAAHGGMGGDDWARNVRRWSASRAASRETGPRPRNPDWYWSPIEPRPAPEPAAIALIMWR